MKEYIKFLYVKWVLRLCPHFCRLCKYRKSDLGNCLWEFTELDIAEYKKNRKERKKNGRK